MKPKRALRVYIAGPMTNGTGRHFDLERIHEGIETYFYLIEHGFVPHCPQLSFMLELMQPSRISYRQWLHLDKQYIDDCDCVLRILGPSKGADAECAYAEGQGKIVYYGIAELVLYCGRPADVV